MPFLIASFFIYILKGGDILAENKTRVITSDSKTEFRGGGGYRQPSQPPTNVKGVPPKK